MRLRGDACAVAAHAYVANGHDDEERLPLALDRSLDDARLVAVPCSKVSAALPAVLDARPGKREDDDGAADEPDAATR